MLALAIIFLATLMVAAAAVWLYRLLFCWPYQEEHVVGRQHELFEIKLRPQQGYVYLLPREIKALERLGRSFNFFSASGGIKAPWGW